MYKPNRETHALTDVLLTERHQRMIEMLAMQESVNPAVIVSGLVQTSLDTIADDLGISDSTGLIDMWNMLRESRDAE